MSLPTTLEVPNIAIAGADALAADVNEDFDYLSAALNDTNTQVNTNTDEITTARNGAVSLDTRLDAADADRALKAYADNAALTGVPTVPTAGVDTNTSQAASTAFVLSQSATATPLQDEDAAKTGTATTFARADHVHPINPQVAADTAAAAASASNAQDYMFTASSAASSAAAAWDSLDDRYLGSKTSDPTLDNDGNTIITGALYFNSTTLEMRVYNGSAWEVCYLPASGYVTLTGTETLTNKTLANGTKFDSDALAQLQATALCF